MTPRYLTLGLPMPSNVVPFDDDEMPVQASFPDLPRRAIVARRNIGLDDWWRIEWVEWKGEPHETTGLNRTLYWTVPARLEPYTCVEGQRYELADLAMAILAGETSEWKRCAVAPIGEHFAFWSPRNSSAIGVAAVVHGGDARDWARGFLGASP